MPRKDKRWVAIDANFTLDAKIDGLSAGAGMFYVSVLSWCKTSANLGSIPHQVCTRLPFYSWRNRQRLVEKGYLLDKGDGIYVVPSWEKWNESPTSVDARLRADRNRKRLRNGIARTAFRIPD